MCDQAKPADPGAMPEKYEFHGIEAHWQRVWDERGTFNAPDDSPDPKLYVLQMFPYPSGDLHAGHIRNYVLGDAMARFHRMKGYNVMHPMGFDSFGLPAEQAAIDREIQPSFWIERCVANSRRQFKRYGFSFDWSREVVTSDPEYYRWTQWLFLKFYEMGLIYRNQIEVNWCPEHGVLANDEVKEGQCWRCDAEVTKKKMEQWCMRTSSFSRRLLDGIEQLPGWTQAVRTMQQHWIGESVGTHIDFAVPAVADRVPADIEAKLTVFTTRVDTIYGCTFMAIAPDHPLVQFLAEAGGTSDALKQFSAECSREAVEYGVANAEDKPKRGLRLGVDCINPFNGEAVPVFATNYVVADFGTGAVMAVPGHDSRDHAFALEYGLPIPQVIRPVEGEAENRKNTRSEGGGRPSVAAPSMKSDGLQISRHRLPHWELPGSVYFISWRLAEKQPKLSPEARSLVYSALKHFDGERYHLIACVVMDDHVHVLTRLHEGQELGKTLHSWRSYTTNQLQREHGYSGAVWQDDYFDRIVRSEEEFSTNLQYILDNPRKRWPESSDYQWLCHNESDFHEAGTGKANSGQDGTSNPVAIDLAVRTGGFQRWFRQVTEEHKFMIRDFEHGEEHYRDRSAAYLTWFNGGVRPKLFRKEPEKSQVDELDHGQWGNLLLGYLVLGRDVTRRYLAGQSDAFGDQWEIPADVLREMESAAAEGRPPEDESTPDNQIECFTEKGICINSGPYDGMDFATAKAAMDEWLEKENKGGRAVQYRLRDWNMGRQRFWGAPIPMVHCAECGWQPVPAAELPVTLPDKADYSDIKVSPLANDHQWQAAKCPGCGGKATRDTDTMTTFMCSAWYYLRYCDPLNDKAIFARDKVEAWLPVDYYIGGKEHAVGHLLYSRVVTMALADAGLIDLTKSCHEGETPPLRDEPFRRLFNQGIVYKDGAKMSKSRGNVVSADDLADQYGADTARLFSFFGGPADQDLEWSTSGVEGCHRFLKRVWRLARAVQQTPPDTNGDTCGEACGAAIRARHKAVAGVTDDVRNWRFNTAIAKLMEYLNELEARWQDADGQDECSAFRMAMLTMAQLLSPFAPHIAEQLWLNLGGMGLCCESDWPIHDPEMLVEDTVEIPVQVNGKVRGRVTVPVDAAEADVLAAVQGDERIAKWVEGKQLVKQIYVPGRMVTLVVKG